MTGRYSGRVHADDIFRAIGKFAVKFRWVVLVLWIAAAVAIPKALPSLASVTQGNNSAFLPGQRAERAGGEPGRAARVHHAICRSRSSPR